MLVGVVGSILVINLQLPTFVLFTYGTYLNSVGQSLNEKSLLIVGIDVYPFPGDCINSLDGRYYWHETNFTNPLYSYKPFFYVRSLDICYKIIYITAYTLPHYANT